jgi:toxin CcdB
MARFDVYALSERTHYVLDVQADYFDHLNTRLVVPLLLAEDAPEPARRLNPRFRIDSRNVIMVTQFMAAIPRAELKQQIANFSQHHDEIVGAIDFLMQGF